MWPTLLRLGELFADGLDINGCVGFWRHLIGQEALLYIHSEGRSRPHTRNVGRSLDAQTVFRDVIKEFRSYFIGFTAGYSVLLFALIFISLLINHYLQTINNNLF